VLFFRTTIFLCRFAQSLLSKGQSSDYYIDSTFNTIFEETPQGWISTSARTIQWTFNWAGTVRMSYSCYFQWTSWTISMLIDWGEVESTFYSQNCYPNLNKEFTVSTWGEHTVAIKIQWSSNWSFSFTQNSW